MKIGIIGAGASGMAAALAAAEKPEVEVLVLERQSRVGRKLLATGNGRCNLTNLHALEGGYHGESPDFSKEALTRFSPEETLAWFRSLGLYTVAEPSGRVYPYSDQANSVVDVLRLAMDAGGELTENFDPQTMESRLVPGLYACGGLAGSKLGGTMSGYQLLGKLGHRSTRLRPALVQIKCGWGGVVGLKGVRANCHVKIFRDEALFAQSTGELQFTEMGLSGPVIFEISRDVCFRKGDWKARLDFLPEMSPAELEAMLLERKQRNFPMEELLTGILHNRLGRVLTKAAGIGGRQAGELTREEIGQVCRTVKAFAIPLTEPLGMDSAQVTAGGELTENFDPQTMESRLVPGLYACGEVLDVDGDCGGYNLQWAWSSGRTAGLHAGKESV